MLMPQLLACLEGYDRTIGTIWNYATGTLTPTERWGALLNRITSSNLTAAKCAPMLAVKQPVCGRAINMEEQNCSSFQTNYGLCKSISFASKDTMSSKYHLIKKMEKIWWHGNKKLKISRVRQDLFKNELVLDTAILQNFLHLFYRIRLNYCFSKEFKRVGPSSFRQNADKRK